MKKSRFVIWGIVATVERFDLDLDGWAETFQKYNNKKRTVLCVDDTPYDNRIPSSS